MDKRRTRLFIVDDDRSFGRSLKRLLIAKEFAAEHFESARAFLDSIPFDQKGIAVVDINMPGCDGFSLIDKMHEMHYSMALIVITGQTEAGSREMAMETGGSGFFAKTF